MVFRTGVESWVELYLVAERLVLDEVGKIIWPSIWVVVLAGLGFVVAVLSSGGSPGGGGSSSGWRIFCRALRLFERDPRVESLRLPFGSSSSFPSALNLAITVVLGLVRLRAKRPWWGNEDARGKLEFLEWVRSGSSPRVVAC